MATKKITELPFIVTVSGSSVFDNPSVNSVVPVVLYGTTNQITVENFSKFTNLYAAQTGSQNIFPYNQWFNAIVSASTINVGTLGVGGNTTIAGTLGVTGNGTIGGNLAVAGRITAEEFYTEITTASVIYASGSTKFGDDTGDKHEFTGSINVSGSVIYNGVILTNIDANTIQRLQQATASIQSTTASLQFHSASVDAQLLAIQQTTQSLQVATASLQAFSSSVNDQLQRVYQTTQSLHVATASLQFHSASVDSQLLAIQQTTQSLQVATASLQQFTASQDSRNFVISQYTSSTDAHIVGISTFTSSQYDTMARVYQATSSLQSTTASLNQFTASQDGRNFTLSQVTGSLIGITNGLMAFTAALDNTYATDAQLYQLYQATRSLELHSGSMVGVTNGLMAYTASNTSLNTGLRGEIDGIEAYTASLKGQAIVSSSTQVQNYDVFALNSNLYTSTGSLIGITNGLMAFTAALDNTYATDAQLYQLYQATRSIELTTGSLIGITNGLMAFTAALDSTYATDAQLYQLYQATQSLELLSGSLIGITNGLMAFTAALDSTYATDAQLYQLYAETASIKAEIGGIELYTASLKAASIVSSSTQVQNYDVFALNSNLYNSTGSIKGEIAGIEAYTASLKGAAIVSSSQQVQNYFTFAQTSSANIFYNYQAISGSKLELHTSDANGGLVINSKATSTQTFITLLDRGTSDNYTVATFEDTNGGNSLGGFAIKGNRKDNQTAVALIGKNKVANSAAVNGNVVGITANAYSDNALTTLTTGVTGKAIAFSGQDTEIASINYNGDLSLVNGNLVVASGKGIDFSATSNGSGTTSSELLNDYEEGTWTPTIIGSGTAGTYTLSGTVAYYTKIGNQVTVFANFGFSAASGGSGYVTIGGLPFSYRTNNSSLGTIMGINFDYSAGMLYAVIAATSSSPSTNIFIQEAQDNTTSTEGPISGVTASTSFRFTYTYTVS